MMTFISTTITIKLGQGEQVVDRDIEAMVAQGTGLAYIQHPSADGEEAGFTLTHVPSGTRLGGDWQAGSSQEAQKWIELLDELADWTQFFPAIRPGKRWKTLHLATIGTLHEVEQKEEYTHEYPV